MGNCRQHNMQCGFPAVIWHHSGAGALCVLSGLVWSSHEESSPHRPTAGALRRMVARALEARAAEPAQQTHSWQHFTTKTHDDTCSGACRPSIANLMPQDQQQRYQGPTCGRRAWRPAPTAASGTAGTPSRRGRPALPCAACSGSSRRSQHGRRPWHAGARLDTTRCIRPCSRS